MNSSRKTPTSQPSSETPKSPENLSESASNHLLKSVGQEFSRQPRRSLEEKKKLILEFLRGLPDASSGKGSNR